MKTYQQSKSPGTEDFIGEFYQTFEKVTPSQTVPKYEKGENIFKLILRDQHYNDTKADRALQRKEKYISMFFKETDKNLEQSISKLLFQKK